MDQQNPGQNALLALFATLPVILLGSFAALITRFGVSPALLPRLRAAQGPIMRELRAKISPAVEAAIPVETHAQQSARAIREDLEGKLNGLSFRINRFADDVYRAVTADAALDQVFGRTPAEAQHIAYERLLRQGITGFTDSQGRNWELSAYVEMAVRTAAQRAYNEARLAELQAHGFGYFIVSDDGHPCPLCQPWQNRVLTDGVPDQIAHHTIAEATAEGLFHPRCRHVLSGYTPGTPIPEPHEWGPADQAAYEESQRQRALERDIRAAKRELAGAFTPEMQATARRKVRQAQARMRDFIEQTGRVRISRREQLGL